MVVDVHSGVTAADQDVATMLRKSGKPIALAVNKCDSVGPVNPDVYEFYSLGIGDLFETSAIHGHGTGDLLDWVLENIPEDSGEEEDSDVIKVAIVGKPNVGKSSLLNRILGEERVIVSDVAGTTRDAIDSYLKTRPENTASSTPPVCAGKARWTTPSKNTPTCAPSAPSTGRTCA